MNMKSSLVIQSPSPSQRPLDPSNPEPHLNLPKRPAKVFQRRNALASWGETSQQNQTKTIFWKRALPFLKQKWLETSFLIFLCAREIDSWKVIMAFELFWDVCFWQFVRFRNLEAEAVYGPARLPVAFAGMLQFIPTSIGSFRNRTSQGGHHRVHRFCLQVSLIHQQIIHLVWKVLEKKTQKQLVFFWHDGMTCRLFVNDLTAEGIQMLSVQKTTEIVTHSHCCFLAKLLEAQQVK